MIIENQAQSRATRHVAGVMFLCGDCGKTKPVGTSGGTGYGWTDPDNPDDKPVCYECCGKRDVADMIATGRAVLYLTYHKGGTARLTNWPGTIEYRAGVRVGRHNIAGHRYDVWFTGPDGRSWHGVTYGDNTQICRCKRLKHQPTT